MGQGKLNITTANWQKQIECAKEHESKTFPGSFCKAFHDGYICWPPTPAGKQATELCRTFSGKEVVGKTDDLSLVAFRSCLENGTWSEAADVSICQENFFALVYISDVVKVTAWIMLACSIISIIAMGISLFIFCYFKSLYCCRLRVHRNFCVAVILSLGCLILESVNVVSQFSIMKIQWLCIGKMPLFAFSSASSCTWMFVEGLHLHSRVTTGIFEKSAPFKLYYFIGWGIPLLLTIIWSSITSQVSSVMCWADAYKSPLTWIITGPELLVLSSNTIFLVNIVRVLVTKHQADKTTEMMQFRKAVRATILLFPLLGTMHLIFAITGLHTNNVDYVHMVLQAIFWSTQGIVFSLLYCFLNADVQAVLRNAYQRFLIKRSLGSSRLRGEQSFSQTSDLTPSASECIELDDHRSK